MKSKTQIDQSENNETSKHALIRQKRYALQSQNMPRVRSILKKLRKIRFSLE